MADYAPADQINAMTTLMTSLLRTLNEDGVLSHDQTRDVIQRAVFMCGQAKEGAGAERYLREVFLQRPVAKDSE